MSGNGQAGVPVGGGPSSRRAPTWPRVAAVVALFVLIVIVAKTCQSSQIKVSQDEALALATEQVRFEPEDTQIRLLRQGLDRHPFWIVSLSVPNPGRATFEELGVVRIDATSGEVVEVRDQRVDQRADDAGGGSGEGGEGP